MSKTNGNSHAHDYQTDLLYAKSLALTKPRRTAELGSVERSEQMDRTVATVDRLVKLMTVQTQQIDRLTTDAGNLARTILSLRIALKAEEQARVAELAAHTRMSRLERLRWLVGL